MDQIMQYFAKEDLLVSYFGKKCKFIPLSAFWMQIVSMFESRKLHEEWQNHAY